MTYCLGIMTRDGLVMMSDSRTNSGYDQVNVCRKMYTFVLPGERVFVLLASGSLSLTQSIITLLGRDFDAADALHRLRERPGMELGNALLDQTAVAGIGNVYKSEVAFLERLCMMPPA